MLSKKYYIMFADMLKRVKNEKVDLKTLGLITNELTRIFQLDNGRFDTNRFIEYINKE